MKIDWLVVATIAAPTIALFIGVWINRRLESRPNLVSYFGHVSAFRHTPAEGSPINVNTHSVILSNTGRRSATNVRIHHRVLPAYNIWPTLVHHVEELEEGSSDIVIPTLVPDEQITISYLYFPPMTAFDINAGIKCDQGFARTIPVLLQRVYPRWFNIISVILTLVGIISLLYLIYLLCRALI